MTVMVMDKLRQMVIVMIKIRLSTLSLEIALVMELTRIVTDWIVPLQQSVQITSLLAQTA